MKGLAIGYPAAPGHPVGHLRQSTRSGASIDQQGELVLVEFPWLKKGNRQNPAWDNTVLGHIVIDGRELTIEVNSQERADTIRRKITC
jgi:hypothetical protein